MRTLTAVAALAIALVIAGCALTRAPERYAAGQNFDKDGKPCTNAAGQPCINQPYQWLKPCGE